VLDRVIVYGAIGRQLDALKREAPHDVEWARAIIDRQAWATRFMVVSRAEREGCLAA
jgi:hypothetical protein